MGYKIILQFTTIKCTSSDTVSLCLYVRSCPMKSGMLQSLQGGTDSATSNSALLSQFMTGRRGYGSRLPVELQPRSAEHKTHNNKSNCYSQLLHDFSRDLMLISKKPESCWLAMAAASCLLSPPLRLCFPPAAAAAAAVAAAAATADLGSAGSCCCHLSMTVTHTALR